MNEYLRRLNKIEFVVTDACTGRCKHCSEGETRSGDKIDPEISADAVRRICAEYEIETVMTFGGEPLLHTEAVYAIISAATELGVPRRQIITNGYFTNNVDRMREVAERLALCGTNDLLLSVDAFHQETIPLDTVMAFAREALRFGIPIRLQPAWLISEADTNSYNERTRALLSAFSDTGIAVSCGNVIFPEGNARKYLSEYFGKQTVENPYVEDPRDVRCVSFSANGDVLSGNVYEKDIMQIIADYAP